MNLLLILNKDDIETVSSVFSLSLTASAAGEKVSIFALGTGASIFTKKKALSIDCCGLTVNDLIEANGKVRVCLCIESHVCSIKKEDVLDNVEVVDILELMQMIREHDRIITF